MTLANQKRGVQMNMAYHGARCMLTYELPLGEIVLDFFDKLKSVARLRVDGLRVQGVPRRPTWSRSTSCSTATRSTRCRSSCTAQSNTAGRAVAAKMRELIPARCLTSAIQAAIGANIIARENIKALRKNVLAKCYGGDITRKRKLLENRRPGKKRMKQIGTVEVPQEAFLAILQVED